MSSLLHSRFSECCVADQRLSGLPNFFSSFRKQIHCPSLHSLARIQTNRTAPQGRRETPHERCIQFISIFLYLSPPSITQCRINAGTRIVRSWNNCGIDKYYTIAEISCFLFFSIAKLSFRGKQRNDPTEAERLGNVSTGTKVSKFTFRNLEGRKKGQPSAAHFSQKTNPDRTWVQ